MNCSERIARVREIMFSKGCDALVVCASDPHSSEYPAPRWKQIEWLTGFTGEAGTLVLTASHAGLWTDSRYFIQAASQLAGTGVELHRMGMDGVETVPQWLAANARIVAVDGRCMSVSGEAEIREALCGDDSDIFRKVVDIPDILDSVWDDRPRIPRSPVITLDQESVGETRQEKIAWLRNFLYSKDCGAMLVTALDEIAWLLNVRGSDIEYNPYVISYLFVTSERVCWFVLKDGTGALPADTVDSFDELRSDGVEILKYEDVFVEVTPSDEGPQRIFLDPATLNLSLYRYICDVFGLDNVVCGDSPVQLRKAVKNSRELEGLREAWFEDGIAMEKFLFWLEHEVASGREVTEMEASVKLTSLRAEIEGYRGNSFENISAYGPNAALPHYQTPRTGSAVICSRGLYLVDSGGHYLFGTTDITRTVPMGECTDLEKEDYTLVLKGMIDLCTAVFPEGTAGCQLDVLARNALWRAHRNFGHGTGHGVGFYLGVHEGPQSIRQNFNRCPMMPGMVTSDEPGIYREGSHGVRHENVILCVPAGESEFGRWLSFETLTLCHIDTSAIIPELMTTEEIKWLNAYNETVYRKLSPHLDAEIAAWLRVRTLPL